MVIMNCETFCLYRIFGPYFLWYKKDVVLLWVIRKLVAVNCDFVVLYGPTVITAGNSVMQNEHELLYAHSLPLGLDALLHRLIDVRDLRHPGV